MGAKGRITSAILHDAVETHPGLTTAVKRLEALGIDHPRATSAVRALLIHALEDLGESWMGETGKRLRRIDHLRGRIAGAVDTVIESGALPAELDRAGLTGLINDLDKEMQALQDLQRHAKAHPTQPDIKRISGAGAAPAEATPAAKPASTRTAKSVSDAPHLQTTMAKLPKEQADLVRAILGAEEGDQLALAIMAHSEMEQERALAAVLAARKPKLDPTQEADLRQAVKKLGTAQNESLRGPGTLANAKRQKALEGLPDELRDAATGDNTVLGPIAEASRSQLLILWKKWKARGSKDKFRNYAYGEMRSFFRPYEAEFQSAFDLANQHGVVLLKDPAAFDPHAPGGRVVNPREGGTDLVGFREHDGDIWYVDDKSHRVAKGETSVSLSRVSAFEENLPKNMLKDVEDIEAGFARQRAQGLEPDPRAVAAAGRLRDCGNELATETAGWTDEQFALPANQRKVAAILNKHRVRLKVTSTMGDVSATTGRLAELGIEVLPPFSTGPRLPVPSVVPDLPPPPNLGVP